MSLTFRNVPKISKRRGRSDSRTKKSYKSSYFKCTVPFRGEEYLNDFPPLRKTMDIDASSLYLPETSSSKFLLDLAPSTFNSTEFLQNNSFEEVRWTDYQRNCSRDAKKYSQCLIKNKFCCQRNQGLYSSKPDVSTLYKKSIGNILGAFKERVLAGKCMEDEMTPQEAILYRKPYFIQPNNAVKTPIGFLSSHKDLTTRPSLLSNQNLYIKHAASHRSIQKQTSLIDIKSAQTNQLNLNFRGQHNVSACTQKIANRTPSSSSIETTIFASRNLRNCFDQPKLLSKISEEHSSISIKPAKERSIHTINEPVKSTQIYQGSIVCPAAHPADFFLKSKFENTYREAQSKGAEQQSLFPNTSWFLHENLSDQFGFNRTLSTVEPVFEQGNLYAECYDFPTVHPDIFRTMVSDDSPVVSKKKDFKTLFSPYGRENCALKRCDVKNSLF